MAFFKFRKTGDEPSASPARHESVEMMRRRAKYRLVGAAVLVLVGVIGFPLLFDKQPRPISVDLPIEIPDRNKAKPLSIPQAAPEAPIARADAPEKSEEKVAKAPVEAAKIASKEVAKDDPTKILKPVEKPIEKSAEKPPVKVDKSDGGAKALALLQGKDLAKKPEADANRYVVQIGAFSDATRAREVRLKVERAGLKTYTHVAKIDGTNMIRVRVGPFSSKAEADKAAEKIKKMALPAAILTL